MRAVKYEYMYYRMCFHRKWSCCPLVKVSSRRNHGQQILYHIWHNKTSLYIKVPTNAHIIFQHSSVKTSCKVNGLRQYKCITLCLNKSKMDLCKECFKVYKFHFMDYGFFFQDILLPFSCKCTNRMFLSLLALTRDIALSFFLMNIEKNK